MNTVRVFETFPLGSCTRGLRESQVLVILKLLLVMHLAENCRYTCICICLLMNTLILAVCSSEVTTLFAVSMITMTRD